MNKSQMVRDYVTAHPKSFSADIAAALGFSNTIVSPVLVHATTRGAMIREEIGRSPTNQPRYVYSINPAFVPPPRKARSPSRVKVATSSDAMSLTTKVQPPTHIQDAIEQFAKTFADMLADAAMKAMRPHLEHRLAASLPELLPAPPKEGVKPPVVLDKPKKGAVVGLLPEQNAEIQARFGHPFDLRFVGNGDYKGAKNAAIGCDRIFLHVGHVNHSTDKALQGGALTRCGGGMTQIIREMEAYYGHSA